MSAVEAMGACAVCIGAEVAVAVVVVVVGTGMGD